MAQALRKKASVSGTRGQGGDNADKIAERTPLSCILIGSEAQDRGDLPETVAAMRRATAIPEPVYEFSQCYSTHQLWGEFYIPLPRRPPPASFAFAPPNPIFRRSRTMGSQDHASARRGRQPWEQMAQTYAWVLEQDFADMALKNEETVQWIRKQQERDLRREQMSRTARAACGARELMEFVDGFVVEVDGCRRIEETWRAAMQWHAEAEKMVQDEVRRLQEARAEAERCRLAYQRRNAEDEAREARRRERERERARIARGEVEKKAWQAYEKRWAAIATSTGPSAQEQLTFESIPWPMVSQPHKVEDITPARVAMFLLSPMHSEGQSKKERVRAALRRWHPDRFGRTLGRVNDQDRVAVEQGAGIIICQEWPYNTRLGHEGINSVLSGTEPNVQY
ncbi:hypothetical protein IEO21_06051 [Rhodonia placenta]|uniref:Uncharacterized protein n=1 Tax=Rhodonia placenta TaxID=104341 RepID=A0A8H7P193_9APHY|nr:hypothetical protein IEO21_06051 [Postia placenta]